MTEARLKQLEKQLSKVTLQRDELQRDVETLCMQGSGNSIFDSSSVLSERIYANEQEISKTRSQLEAVTEERDHLREDLKGYRDTKRQSDNGWRAEKQRVQALEKELAFYQTHSTKAFADRDQAVLEAEQLKADNLSLQRRLTKAESLAAQSAAALRETQSQLESAQQRLAELEIKETECQAIPGLRQDLSEAKDQVEDLTHSLQVARSEGADARRRAEEATASYESIQAEYSRAQSEATQAAEAAAAETSGLQGQLAQLQLERDRLDKRATVAERDHAAASSELQETKLNLKVKLEEQQNQFKAIEEEQYSDWEKRVLAVQQKEDRLQKQAKELQAERDQATQDKVQALMRLSDSERSKQRISNQVDTLKKQNQDLSHRLSQATQEKVNALMRVAADGNSSQAAANAKGMLSPGKASTWKDTLASWRTPSAAASPVDVTSLDADKDSDKSHSAASTPNSH
ncbi:hypothetical protein ABBQ38_010362 [Trebouxia sp. C0009 RCD-2024]